MKRPSVQGMFLSFISQELPPWNVNPNSRRVTTNLAHKGLGQVDGCGNLYSSV